MTYLKITAAFLAVLAMSGCDANAGGGSGLHRLHDDEIGVTCWRDQWAGAISCIPDWMLDRGAVEPESLEGME